MESTAEKTVKLPTFDGTHKKFPVFWMRFFAFAVVHKFSGALGKTAAEAALPANESDAIDPGDAGKAARDAKSRNAVAMANFSMAFTTEAMMGLLYKAQTAEWPSGLAWKVVEGLFKKFQPQDTITRVELRQMLNKVSMKSNDDPATLFEQLSGIENRYNTPTQRLDPQDMIAVVLDAAPNEYKSILTAEQRLRAGGLNLGHLEEAMTQHWRDASYRGIICYRGRIQQWSELLSRHDVCQACVGINGLESEAADGFGNGQQRVCRLDKQLECRWTNSTCGYQSQFHA